MLLAAAMILALPGTNARAQLSEGIQVKHPLPDTFFAIVFHPQVLLANNSMSDMDKGRFVERVEQQFGVDISKLNQVHMQFSTRVNEDNENVRQATYTVTADAAFDQENFQEIWFKGEDTQEVEHEQTAFMYASRPYVFDGRGLAIWFSDENSVVLGSLSAVESTIEGGDEDRPEALTSFTLENDICGYLDFARDPDVTYEILERFFRGAPFYSEEFVESLAKIEQAHFQVNLNDDQALVAMAETDSQETAEDVSGFLQEAVEAFHDELENTGIEMSDTEDGSRAAIQGMISILKHTTASSEGNRVRLIVEKKGRYDRGNGFIHGGHVGRPQYDVRLWSRKSRRSYSTLDQEMDCNRRAYMLSKSGDVRVWRRSLGSTRKRFFR